MAKRLPLLKQIEAALKPLDNVPGWQAELALALAETFDAEPNAALSHQIRLVMNDITQGTTSTETVDAADELRKRREQRNAERADTRSEAEGSIGS